MKRRLLVLFAFSVGFVYLSMSLSTPPSGFSASKGTPLAVEPPLGLPPVPIPADNPMTVEKVELGKMLYFDKRLSKDKTISCATCHMPENAYTEPRNVSTGIDDQKGEMNSPHVINSAYATSMFWDGRMNTLEEQAAGPVENPIEMGHKIGDVAGDLNAIPEYKKRFMDVFGEPASKETITKAIAAFERTLLSGNSPYDRYKSGDKNAMSADAIKGMELFNQKLCVTCHTPPLFSNWGFYNTGVGYGKGEPPIGRKAVTNLDSDQGAFRVSSLRNIAETAPYFHNGEAKTLREAVAFMAKGGKQNPNQHALFLALKGMKITDDEIDKITAFLESLTGEYPVVEEPKLP